MTEIEKLRHGSATTTRLEHAAGEDDVWDDHGDCPICTTPPENAYDLPWPAARWSPNAPAGVTDPANPGTEHHP